jgi:stage V sporulation protein B
MILPLYSLLAATAGLGLSGAVTKMVADRHAKGDRDCRLQIRALSMKLTLAATLAGTLLLWLFLTVPLGFIPDHRIILSLRLLPAAITLAALSSILRGYTQGQNNMTPTALSQIGEQIVRVSLGLAAAWYLLPLGLEYALAGVVIGIIGGEAACFLINYLMQSERALFTKGKPIPAPVYRELFTLSLPILLIRLSTAITQTAESVLIPSRLQLAGYSASAATTLFGRLTGMALPIIFLPTVLIIPLATALVPAVAGAASMHLRPRLERLIKLSLLLTVVIGASAALTLYILAEPFTIILYGNNEAAELVRQLAPMTPFAYLQFSTAAILHGLGKPGIAVANDLAGTLISLTMIYFLTSSPGYGLTGVVYGYTTAFILITLSDLFCIFYLIRKR